MRRFTFILELPITLPDHFSVLAGTMPYLRAVRAPAISAPDLSGENSLFSVCFVVQELLHQFILLRRDDRRVTVFNEIPLDFPVVFHLLFGEIIDRVRLLKQRTALIFFIPKYSGVDTMCAVGANRCIVGASMGAY